MPEYFNDDLIVEYAGADTVIANKGTHSYTVTAAA
jgi:hypothetical protein